MTRRLLLIICCAWAVCEDSPAGQPRYDLDEQEVQKVAAMLPEMPFGIAPSLSDRKEWKRLAGTPEGQKILKSAESLLKEAMLELTDDVYMDYFKTGNRDRGQKVISGRWRRFRCLALAELLEGKSRFIPALQDTIASLCADKSWALPAHDKNHEIFDGKTVYVDLASAASGFDMALVLNLLGAKLDDKTENLAKSNIDRRIVKPVFDYIYGRDDFSGSRGWWWANAKMNWNAVCTAGAVGTILASVESRTDRAIAVLFAQKNVDVYLSGFYEDGYCSEGIGYWSYGFGNFIMLTEVLRRNTGGKVDLFQDRRVPAAAAFPLSMRMVGDIWPAFADCSVSAQPSREAIHYVERRVYGDRLKMKEPDGVLNSSCDLYETFINVFSSGRSDKLAQVADAPEVGMRSWFGKAGVLIARPDKPPDKHADGFAVALKAGHNGEDHNHNDVGSYVVVNIGEILVIDPGSPVYTAQTFSSRRYEIPVINSFGHSLPVIDGQLQVSGAKARGEVFKTEFGNNRDTLSIDMTSCYQVKGLKSITRSWVYERTGKTGLCLTDEMQSDRPVRFESAIVINGAWKNLGDDKYKIAGKKADLNVEIISDQPFVIDVAEVENQGRFEPTRVAIKFTDLVQTAKLQIKFQP